ncbi:hypothetical protein D9758_003776 [Tetrapyrgos nigripes]|uniref:Cyclin N-terminal domain-containing protein n=1 Tax=Tetrapyrgos nigripes TaxID=182062 RepID=A0A8H5LS48_9AGAR|nr:hypothetical protein D9758_003776 [Tetrapyrgos nigripes]
MASNHARLPLRSRPMAHRGKADENATSKHVRQPSGIGRAGGSGIVHKEGVIGTKGNVARPALGEVTTFAVNRNKETSSRVFTGKNKDEVSLKRGRSDSSSNVAQRVPLGPGRAPAAPPVANVAPVRAHPPRATLPPTSISFNQPKRLPRIESVASIQEETARNVVHDDVDMDVEEDEPPVIPLSEEPDALSDILVEHYIASEADTNMILIEAEEDSEDDLPSGIKLESRRAPKIWPDLATAQKAKCQRKVQTIREVFEGDDEEFDPSMVSEYAEEIFEYMSHLEERMMPKSNYMEVQTELNWDMRETLVDWLLQIHLKYHMLPETLWIAVNIVDRFLSQRVVSVAKLQLVGVTAMFIAAKYEEIMAPSVDEFVFMTEEAFTKEEILKGERIVLQALEFQISHYCSPYNWMRRISKADDYDLHTRTLSKFLIEVALLDHRFLRAKASVIAAVGMYTARKMLEGDWSDAFVYYSGFTEEELVAGHSYIVEKLVEEGFKKSYLYKKYANKKFLKASLFATNWACDLVEASGGILSDDEA